jgi:glycosyltransferase involved in cell wall biosynthesis
LVDIIIIRSNSVIYDTRVRKIVSSLCKRYSVSVLGWNREGALKKTIDNYIVDLKLFNLKAPFGKSSLIAYFPLFWIWVLIKLSVYKPKVVHACDLDTILPSYLYKIIFRKRLVFDIFDRYAMAYIPSRFAALHSLVNLSEELFSKKADVLITVWEKVQRTFRRKPRHCAIIMNCPEDHAIDKVKSENEVMTLVYTGNIRRERGLEEIIAAVKDLKNVEFIIAGRVIDKELLDQMLVVSNVKYKGILQPSDALDLEASSDVMVALYDLNTPLNRVSMSNKHFEAMMCGIPLITNTGRELINEVDYGIMVGYNDVNQIKAAVVCLRDDIELRRRLGNNGRKAFLQKYNWSMMEQELYKIYESLLEK